MHFDPNGYHHPPHMRGGHPPGMRQEMMAPPVPRPIPMRFRGEGFNPYVRQSFLDNFRTREGTIDYNKMIAVIDQTMKVAQRVSPLLSIFKKKE
ncbi:YppG family protein [Fictibacillus sp. Mic-4]|uniref:YppG family protein n=1 Tax=Fictibacillus TaxID=1329200 RepID=UPI0003FED8D2|nr:YppG family protein [Fictibacillus gelatini]